MSKQPKTEQWEITSEFKTSNNYIIRRLGSLLLVAEDWEKIVKAGNKGTYKRIGADRSKVCNIILYRNLPTSQNNSFVNGQYSDTFLHCRKGGTHTKVLSDLTKKNRDYLLENGIMIIVEYLPGTLNVEVDHHSRSVTDSNKWKLNTLICKKICKVFWTPNINLLSSIKSHQVPAYLAWRPDPFSKGTDAFQLSWRNLKGYAFLKGTQRHFRLAFTVQS